jgi:hypothetical protein
MFYVIFDATLEGSPFIFYKSAHHQAGPRFRVIKESGWGMVNAQT